MTKVECIKYRRRNAIVRKVSEWKRRRISYPKYRIERKREWQNQGEAAHPIEGKVQQGSVWIELPKGITKEKGKQRDLRRTFKILREVWLNIGIKKIDTYEGTTVKVLLGSETTRVFMDRKMAAKHSFQLQKLERPLTVKNVDGTYNSGEAITH